MYTNNFQERTEADISCKSKNVNKTKQDVAI